MHRSLLQWRNCSRKILNFSGMSSIKRIWMSLKKIWFQHLSQYSLIAENNFMCMLIHQLSCQDQCWHNQVTTLLITLLHFLVESYQMHKYIIPLQNGKDLIWYIHYRNLYNSYWLVISRCLHTIMLWNTLSISHSSRGGLSRGSYLLRI